MKIHPSIYALWGLLLLAACSAADADDPAAVPQPGIAPKDGVFARRGEGSFVFTGYAPLKEKPVSLFYYIPTRGEVERMPVLFSMHGAERDATIQRDAWKYLAEAYGFVVLAPQYDKALYSENDYQFGGVFSAAGSGELNDPSRWTYRTVEALFDYFKNETGNTSATYSMFGHSAGGQFVHRFLLAMPGARVGRAVAANPGAWTFPYADGIAGADGKRYGWPCSVAATPFADAEHLSAFFTRELYVQLGTADTDENDASLPRDIPSQAQGPHRYARGRNFFAACRSAAKEAGLPLHFRLAEVEGVGHSTLRMVYGKPVVSNPSDTENRGANSAYHLLFE
ncbi:PHB depolymerase family esterase [Alistipes sp.]|uniref:PHB depolymerase family esterase n=1 Tax=Alistipes sp. TaxID=1872444 RepID=UPI003AF125DB